MYGIVLSRAGAENAAQLLREVQWQRFGAPFFGEGGGGIAQIFYKSKACQGRRHTKLWLALRLISAVTRLAVPSFILLYFFFFFLFLIRDDAKGQRCVRTAAAVTTNKRYQEFHFLAPAEAKTKTKTKAEEEAEASENKRKRNEKTTRAITKRTHLAKIKKMPAN